MARILSYNDGMLFVLACAAPTVVWKGQAADQVAADVAVTLFTLGVGETDDRALVAAPHAAGTTLDMEVELYEYESDAVGVVALDPDVCTVETLGRSGESTEIRLRFVGAGSTDLFLTTQAEGVVDWQPIEVRDPVALDLHAYEALVVEDTSMLTDLHVVPGSTGTLTGAWRSATGEALSGRGLLAASATELITVEVPEEAASLAYERLDYVVADDAVGSTEITLSAGATDVDALTVVVHDVSEVLEVTLSAQTRMEDGLESGVIRGMALIADAVIAGPPLVWSQDGVEVGTGSWVEIGGDDPLTRTIRACLGDLCEEVPVSGEVVFVGTSAPASTACGCGSAAGAPWAAVFGLVATMWRRRKA